MPDAYSRTIIVFGGSRGLGYSLIQGLALPGDHFIIISRTPPPDGSVSGRYVQKWIPCDLSNPDEYKDVYESLKDLKIDVVIYNAGIWELNGFEEVSTDDIRSIINVNLFSPVIFLQKLIPGIKQGRLKKIILIGSTCGLENEGSDSVVYNATKFGLRGVTHALREYLRKDLISVSCISPGSVASDISFEEGAGAALSKYEGKKIPVADIINLVRLIIESSFATCIKEVHIPATLDTDV